jgi:uncharacterized protein (TIGR02391 family)
MTDLEKLRKYIEELSTLKELHWKDPKISIWINRVLCYLKIEFGENSDFYKQFYNITYGRPVVVSAGTPDYVFQKEHLEMLEEYRAYLSAFLEELQEGDPIQESKFPKELKLHPKIIEASERLFRDRHYSQAIFEAVKVLEKEIKRKSGIRDKIGVDLANHVFNEKNPIIKIVDGDELEHVDERKGFRFLYMGAFYGIKNPKSHSTPNLEDSGKALEYLAFLSLLMKRLDEAST